MRYFAPLLAMVVALLVYPGIARAENRTFAGFAKAEPRSSSWIAVEAPFVGDGNENGYTVFRFGTNASIVPSLSWCTS